MSHSRRRRSTPKSLFLLFSLLVLPFIVLILFFYSQTRPTDSSSPQNITFTIKKGAGLDSIAADLKAQDLIHSVPIFKLQVMLSGVSRQIQAGDFALTKSMSLPQIVLSLTHGTSDRKVTFLEGWRRQEFAAAADAALKPNNPDYQFDPDQFVALTSNLEGQLAPNTYFLPRSITASDLVDILTTQYQDNISSLKNQTNLSAYQALILASLIEREAITNAERPVIAGILLNRLNNSWPLQVDATIQFVKSNINCDSLDCDWWRNDITRADLSLDSPFNTYLYPGLPPSPISNPSLESLKAVYQPQPTDYWFYLHDSDGQIHYADSIEKHDQNINQYLQ